MPFGESPPKEMSKMECRIIGCRIPAKGKTQRCFAHQAKISYEWIDNAHDEALKKE